MASSDTDSGDRGQPTLSASAETPPPTTETQPAGDHASAPSDESTVKHDSQA